MIFEGIAVLAVLAFIVSRVLRQDKWLGSIIQMGEVQRREAVHNDIVDQRQQQQQSGVAVARVGLSSGDRTAFTLGILNIVLSSYILGAWPTSYLYWYSPKAVVLITMRWIEFRKRGTHYLLFDFCYFANFLLLVYLWVLPHREDVFQIVFVCANGPLAWAILAFNQSLVLHKWPQITSVFIHVSPALVTLGLRWHASAFAVCASWPACQDTSHLQLVWSALSRFYLWWILFYYVFIFLAMREYLQTRSYSTLYDRVAGNQMKAVFSHQRVAALPDWVKKGVYCVIHILFATFTMSVATLLFYSWYLHVLFILTMISMSAYNASSFYKAQFLQDAAEEAKRK